MNKRLLLATLIAVDSIDTMGIAHAQKYPDHPLRLAT
jgi:hypothetical protein